ncbi:MAG TPA: zinc-ribbon domain-containing protein, partial [Chthoniobacterales bacterium]
MICQRCGSSIQPENKFCPNCGTTLDAPAQAGDPTSPAHAAGQFVPESGKKRSIVKILVIVGAIFIILALAGAVGVFFGVRYLLKSS